MKAHSLPGRMLLALRAGTMEYSQLMERFGNCNPHGYLASLIPGDLVERFDDGQYRLTEAGRAACPTRRQTREDACA